MGADQGRYAAASPTPAGGYPSPLTAGWILGLLVFAAVIAFVDQQLLALLLTPIEHDLALSDRSVGLLQGIGFNLFLGLTVIPVSLIIDRSNRVRFFFTSTAAWSTFTIACGFCTSFYPLFFCRLGVGLAEAGLYPAAFSLIADLYPQRQRNTAIFIFYVCALGGFSIATALSGFAIGTIEDHFRAVSSTSIFTSPWRTTFLVVGAPGFVLALLFAVAREPVRQTTQQTETNDNASISFRSYLRANSITVFRLIGGIALTYGGFNTFLFWMPTILYRAFGYSTASSGEIYGLTFGAGAISGILIAGILLRWRSRFSEPLGPLRILKIGALGSALALPLFLLARNADQLLLLYFLLCAATYVGSTAGSVLLTAIAPNHMRARVFAINQMLGVFIISALHPSVGMLSDHISSSPAGLLYASCAVTIPLVFAALLLLANLDRLFLQTIRGPAVNVDVVAGGLKT